MIDLCIIGCATAEDKSSILISTPTYQSEQRYIDNVPI